MAKKKIKQLIENFKALRFILVPLLLFSFLWILFALGYFGNLTLNFVMGLWTILSLIYILLLIPREVYKEAFSL